MTTPTQPLDSGVPQTLKPKRISGEKTLCNVKCPDGWRKLIKFFLGSAGALWLEIVIKQKSFLDSQELVTRKNVRRTSSKCILQAKSSWESLGLHWDFVIVLKVLFFIFLSSNNQNLDFSLSAQWPGRLKSLFFCTLPCKNIVKIKWFFLNAYCSMLWMRMSH